MWQIRPNELPIDMPCMALELWLVPLPSDDLAPKLVLFQMFTADRKRDWYLRVTGFARFEQAEVE